MRGKVSIIQLPFRLCGITPAYAGKSVLGDPRCHSSRDHPRLCGEKAEKLYEILLGEGSPPPMRGKVRGSPEQPFFQGITPAYAGKRCIFFWRVVVV